MHLERTGKGDKNAKPLIGVHIAGLYPSKLEGGEKGERLKAQRDRYDKAGENSPLVHCVAVFHSKF